MRRTVFILLCVAVAGDQALASFSSSDKGTTTANFLKLGVGARGEAMGEAYSALADDANALYWNPAGLTRLPDGSASATFMHAPYIDPSYYDFAGYAQNLGKAGVLGGAIQYFSGGSITQTDINDASLGTFTPYDIAASMSYAHTLYGYGLGLTGKFIRSQLLDSAQTEAMDFGILTPGYLNNRLRLAFVGTNIGGQMKFDQESFGLPLNLKIGSAYSLTPDWKATLDYNFPVDNNPYAAVGSEYLLNLGMGWTFAGRLGYNARTAGDIDGVTGVAGGMGIQLSNYSIDYAFVPMGQLGLTQRISISMRFYTSGANGSLMSPDRDKMKTSYSLSDDFLNYDALDAQEHKH